MLKSVKANWKSRKYFVVLKKGVLWLTSAGMVSDHPSLCPSKAWSEGRNLYFDGSIHRMGFPFHP